MENKPITKEIVEKITRNLIGTCGISFKEALFEHCPDYNINSMTPEL